MLICLDDAGGGGTATCTLQSEQEWSLTPLLTRVGPARRYAVVLRAGAGVIRPGSTYRGGAQQHGPREAAPRRTTNGTARGRGAPIGFCTKFTEEIGQVHTTKYCTGRGHI